MTILGPRPVRENVIELAEPSPRWRRFVPGSRRGKATVAAVTAGVLVVGVLGAAYETSPGGALWGVTRTVFPGHAQDVALTAVVEDLKRAQDILGSGQQPTADQLTDARTALNQAKLDLDYLSLSPERDSLQNLYLQLTQQLLQYTPDSVLRLAPLPAPPSGPLPTAPQQDDVALTSATAPTWGYGAPDDYVPAPAGVPTSPMADWPQPIDPPVTPNIANLGYYDPSWGQLYGYDRGGWYNYDLGGYNQYGYDFIGFDRWGYDRWGYDRWGYDRWGYNWAGYNWAGYDRHGWDRHGRNEWGQHRDRPGDPRNQGWYDRHHPYQQYYRWKFRNHNPVYRRAQWDRAHGFNPHLYQNWNRHRDWHNPRNRDWAPPSVPARTTIDIHISSPVVNLNASLTQFISNDKATRASGPLKRDLADKSARNFAEDLTPPTNPLSGWQLPSTLGQRPDEPKKSHQTSFAPAELTEPPALAAPAPDAPPSKVSPDFSAPKLSPAPADEPPTIDKPRGKPQTAPAPEADPDLSPGQPAAPPRADRPNPPAASPDQPEPVSPPDPAMDRPDEVPAPREAAPDAPRQQEPPKQWNAPEEPPVQRDPVPKRQAPQPEAPAPKEAPVREAPVWQQPEPEAPASKEAPAPKYQAPERQAPVWQEPVRQAPPQEAPARQRPPREEPAQQEPPAREAPAPRQAPQQRSEPESPKGKGPKCPPPMCSEHE